MIIQNALRDGASGDGYNTLFTKLRYFIIQQTSLDRHGAAFSQT